MAVRLPEIDLEHDSEDTDQVVIVLDNAIETLDRHTQLAVQLFAARSEDFHPIAEQAHEQMRGILRVANQVADEYYRKDFRRRLHRVQAVISFLQEYGPYVEGSGVLRSRNPREKIQSVTPGGLPGQGKRR